MAQIEFADMHAVRTEWEASRRRREEELQKQIVELKGLSCTERAVTLIVEELNLICQASWGKDADTTVVSAFDDRCSILQFAEPYGLVAVGSLRPRSEGRILVMDWERVRLQILEIDGSLLLVSCGSAEEGALFGYTAEDLRRADEILEPIGVAVDDIGQIVALDREAKCVKVYDNPVDNPVDRVVSVR